MRTRQILEALGAIATIIFIACLTCGCAARIPGDGRLVLVTADETLANTTYPFKDANGNAGTIRVGDALRKGVHYWDALGAKLRTAEDITPEDGEPVATLHYKVASALDELFVGADSWYSTVDGDVHIPIDRLGVRDTQEGFTDLTVTADLAHEAGHALGLMHISDTSALMYRAASWRDDLSASDKVEFCKTAIYAAGECP